MIEKQFVIFKLADQEYGIDIMDVKEIIPYQVIKEIPNSPTFLEGVINYRETVAPVIALKKRFHIQDKLENKKRIIIISPKEKYLGFVVDEASHTIKLNENEISKAPDILSLSQKRYIKGVGKKEEKLLLLMDLERVLTENEASELENMQIWLKQFNLKGAGG